MRIRAIGFARSRTIAGHPRGEPLQRVFRWGMEWGRFNSVNTFYWTGALGC
jgi:hypothetical protein